MSLGGRLGGGGWGVGGGGRRGKAMEGGERGSRGGGNIRARSFLDCSSHRLLFHIVKMLSL